jgi:hypothetical protein
MCIYVCMYVCAKVSHSTAIGIHTCMHTHICNTQVCHKCPDSAVCPNGGKPIFGTAVSSKLELQGSDLDIASFSEGSAVDALAQSIAASAQVDMCKVSIESACSTTDCSPLGCTCVSIPGAASCNSESNQTRRGEWRSAATRRSTLAELLQSGASRLRYIQNWVFYKPLDEFAPAAETEAWPQGDVVLLPGRQWVTSSSRDQPAGKRRGNINKPASARHSYIQQTVEQPRGGGRLHTRAGGGVEVAFKVIVERSDPTVSLENLAARLTSSDMNALISKELQSRNISASAVVKETSKPDAATLAKAGWVYEIRNGQVIVYVCIRT